MRFTFQRSAQIVGARPLFCFIFLADFLQELIPASRELSRAVSHQWQLWHRIVGSLIIAFKVRRMIGLTMDGIIISVQPLFRTLTT